MAINRSAIFLKDGEEIEIHITTKVDIMLGLDGLEIQDLFGKVFNKLSDPDR